MRGVFANFAVAFCALTSWSANATDGTANPMQQFLSAADRNDFAAVESILDSKLKDAGGRWMSPSDFVKKISNCYLRRVYDDRISQRLLATWMCDEGEGKSRVIVATLGTHAGKVQLVVDLENRNNRPAPARTGSAFGEEPKP